MNGEFPLAQFPSGCEVTDLRARLEQLMVWDEKSAYLQAGYGGHFVNGAKYQHTRDLDVLRKMAACLEKCDEKLEFVENKLLAALDNADDWFDSTRESAQVLSDLKAEIARLVEGK